MESPEMLASLLKESAQIGRMESVLIASELKQGAETAQMESELVMASLLKKEK
jgi:hypothetical protein